MAALEPRTQQWRPSKARGTIATRLYTALSILVLLLLTIYFFPVAAFLGGSLLIGFGDFLILGIALWAIGSEVLGELLIALALFVLVYWWFGHGPVDQLNANPAEAISKIETASPRDLRALADMYGRLDPAIKKAFDDRLMQLREAAKEDF
jgi:signal transduction histidine kinase